MRTTTGLMLGGAAAIALAAAMTSITGPPALDTQRATHTLDAVQDVRATAYALGAMPAPIPRGLTTRMRADLRHQQETIRAVAQRDGGEIYEAADARVEVRSILCGGPTCGVDYRVITQYRRPAGAVAVGAPATMDTATNRHAEFRHDGSDGWLLDQDHTTEPPGGVPDPLDAATGER